jgi:hypothetical protein
MVNKCERGMARLPTFLIFSHCPFNVAPWSFHHGATIRKSWRTQKGEKARLG